MQHSKLLSLVGLAKKAGRISIGHDAVLETIKKKKAIVILLASDASERLEREMQRELAFEKSDAKLIRITHTMEEIGKALPKKAAVMSINDTAFAAGIMNVIEEG